MLLQPTVIYVKTVLELHDKVGLNGVVHITGGGFPENIPRVVPKGLGVQISAGSWRVPDIFQWIQKAGKISDAEMRRTFNMGIGLVMGVDEGKAAAVQQLAPDAVVMGRIVKGSGVTFV